MQNNNFHIFVNRRLFYDILKKAVISCPWDLQDANNRSPVSCLPLQKYI